MGSSSSAGITRCSRCCSPARICRGAGRPPLWTPIDPRSPTAARSRSWPGGGKVKTTAGESQPSHASEAGEHVFWATLDDGTAAIYQVDTVGKLALVLKSGTPTELGTISKILTNSGAVVNSRGQVALAVQIDPPAPRVPGPDTLVLLTPAAQ